jgi:SseB protein N-terminal domain
MMAHINDDGAMPADGPSADGTPEGSTPAQQALSTLAGRTDDEAALDTLAASEVLVPVPVDAQDPGEPDQVILPVIEQPNGVRQVPVFTSEPRMAQALPAIHSYLRLPLGFLAARWPDDELTLTIDAGAGDALTLPAEGVRTLLAREA